MDTYMIYQIVVLIFIIVPIIIGSIDIIPTFLTWLSRIHIGRYNDIQKWNKSITNVGIKWLNNTPKIKVTDNTRLVVIDMLKGNYSRNTIQHWQEASLLLGLNEYLKNNDDKKVKPSIEKFLSSKFDNEGQWKNKPEHIDGAILAYAVIQLDFINIDKYKQALDYIWNLIQEHVGEDGTVKYRNFMNDYRYVDTIGFICPFLVCYGKRYNKPECIELSIKQITEYNKYGILNNHYIPCHAYKLGNNIPMGLYGWGRGLGWYAIGLIDSWSELEQENEHKKTLEEFIITFAKSAIEFQHKNGAWSWTVTRPETILDSSTTATLSWFMLNASKIDAISDVCIASYNKAIKYLMSVTKRNGSIDFSQGDTKDIGVYSLLFDILPFTQGFAIRTINKKYNKS